MTAFAEASAENDELKKKRSRTFNSGSSNSNSHALNHTSIESTLVQNLNLKHQTTATRNIYIRTPLIESVQFRKFTVQRRCYLKLENCQPCASFKLRGISNLCKFAKAQGFESFVCPSGGNAGLATAYSAMRLQMPCHIVVSEQTPESTKETIAAFGASVEVFGRSVGDSVGRARTLAKENPKSFLIHPYDHPAIWEGHSTIIDEVVEELGMEQEPSIIVTCCGGGGLINGLVQGCRRYGWINTRVLAMESMGCHSFNKALENDAKPFKMEITSSVTCLSCDTVCQRLMDHYQQAKPPILSRVIEDRDAAEGVIRFADDHRLLVGLACGTCLAALYKGFVERILLNKEDDFDMRYDKQIVDINGLSLIHI